MKLKYNDELHAYWLNGQRCTGVTGLAKIPEDTYRMEMAAQRKVAVGLALTPKLIEAVAANIDDADELASIIEKAKEAGGAHEGRDRGITTHTITERHDLGKQIVETPLSIEIISSWQELINAAGLTILPEFVERMIVYPDRLIAGRLDRIVRLQDGRLAILDVKGGKWAVKYPRSPAIQLALYANAPLIASNIYRTVGPSTIEVDDFEPMPDVDKEWGIIAHFPEDGPPQLVDVNIASGWKAAQLLCFPTQKWRRKNGLTRPHRLLPVGLRPVMPAPPTPAWQPPEEGPEVDEADVARLRDAFKACEGRVAVDAWIKQSVDAGRSFNIAGPGCSPTLRRFQIIEAAMAWSVHPEDVVRAALGLVLGEEVQPAVSIGCALGSLTVSEAATLEAFADDLDHGRLALTFAEDGSPVLSEAQPLPAA